MSADPLADGMLDPERKPFDANQAIPTLLVGRYRDHFTQQYPTLKIRRAEYMSLLAYPLSGGFRSWSLIPAAGVKKLLSIERRLLAPLFGRLAGFRLFIVIEKENESQP